MMIYLAWAALLLGETSLTEKLQNLTWKKRVVVIYSPHRNDAEFQLQKKLFEGFYNDFLERDLVVLEYTLANLSVEDRQVLNQRFEYNPRRFGCWLVGKDGTIKLSSYEPVNSSVLFGLIDAMPMRQAEKKKS
ncbi:DUF4174 domain-containing protein [Runella zeae]|uniref:DUF4174 domain-containing protein n=1 Tax=Runella zeae TaxID=94255 RepID=UPI0023527D3A|nr:DUF4174 domain-containing protein [Runella zeae]